MNLEIASRLVALRKENNLSQEALAEKLGISRQAVSKWERAEASPDTDNLIALAKLYHVSLDELLKIHEEEGDEEPHDSEKKALLMELQTGVEFGADTENQGEEKESGKYEQSGADEVEEDVHVGFDGIHVKDKDGEVHVSWRGIHVHDMKNDNEVHIDKNGIRVNGDEARDHIFTRGKEAELPLGIIAIVVYILTGIFFDLWHPGWLIFFMVPIISTLIHAVRQHNPDLFAYPVLALLVFLYAGIMYSLWHPAWAVFLTIPVYYSITGYIRRAYTKDVEEEQDDRDIL
ncbi:MAG: helix-turn-helix domain-containing protein [Lachnospiraceae bacterium]|nr:helix-turn-helix domain-containing protein [Lachnospiraceae bacterium]